MLGDEYIYLNSKSKRTMGRKGQKNARKTSYNEGQNRVKYQEKPTGEWKCGVCDRKYDQNQSYC